MQPGSEITEDKIQQELGVYFLDRQNHKRTSSWEKPQKLRRNYTAARTELNDRKLNRGYRSVRPRASKGKGKKGKSSGKGG